MDTLRRTNFGFPKHILVASYSEDPLGTRRNESQVNTVTQGTSFCDLPNTRLRYAWPICCLVPTLRGEVQARIPPTLLKHWQTWNVSSVTTKDASFSLHLLLRLRQRSPSSYLAITRSQSMHCTCVIIPNMPSIGNKFVITPLLVQCPIYKHHARGPTAYQFFIVINTRSNIR